jgi:hypothetical protein
MRPFLRIAKLKQLGGISIRHHYSIDYVLRLDKHYLGRTFRIEIRATANVSSERRRRSLETGAVARSH